MGPPWGVAPDGRGGAWGIPKLVLVSSVRGWGPLVPGSGGGAGSGLLWVGRVCGVQDCGFLFVIFILYGNIAFAKKLISSVAQLCPTL